MRRRANNLHFCPSLGSQVCCLYLTSTEQKQGFGVKSQPAWVSQRDRLRFAQALLWDGVLVGLPRAPRCPGRRGAQRALRANTPAR